MAVNLDSKNRDPIHDVKKPAYQATDLKDAIFIKDEAGHLVASHKAISAILLVNVSESVSTVTGILHQEANFPFDIFNLPSVPFIRLLWPVLNGKINTEWVRSGHPAPVWHIPI